MLSCSCCDVHFSLLPLQHHNLLRFGLSKPIKPSIIRMHHYWGGRLQNFQPNMTRELEAKTMPDDAMSAFVPKIQECFDDALSEPADARKKI